MAIFLNFQSMKNKLIFFLLGSVILLAALAGFAYHQFTHRVEGQYFESGGVKIHYTVEGEGEPVVLVHGFAVNGDLNWRKPGIISHLSKHYRVITMDVRGHGLSGKPHDPSQYGTRLADDVVSLLEHLEIERAHLVGYSLGGFIALKAAAMYPDKWLSIVPMASGWENPETSKGLAALSQVADDLKAGKSVGPIISYFDERKKPGFLHTWWVKILTTWFNDRDALIALVQSAAELAVTEDELRSIPHAVCCIVGSEDPFLKSANSINGIIKSFQLHVMDGEDHITLPSKKNTHLILESFLKGNGAKELSVR